MKKKRRKRRKKIAVDPSPIQEQNWKDKKPYKYLFGAFGITGIAIDSFASLLTWLFIIAIFLTVPMIWWDTFLDGPTVWSIFNSILLTLFIWVIIGFCIEEFDGLKSIIYIFVFLILGSLVYGLYDNFKFNRCVDKFLERPNTFDKKAFVDCKMISSDDAINRSLNSIKSEMYNKFYRSK